MKRLSTAESQALIREHEAGEAWVEWCRFALRRSGIVRLDISPRSLREVPRFVQAAPGVVLRTSDGSTNSGVYSATEEG